jgi:hypothetical protein
MVVQGIVMVGEKIEIAPLVYFAAGCSPLKIYITTLELTCHDFQRYSFIGVLKLTIEYVN